MRANRWPSKILSCLLVAAILGGVIPYRAARAELVPTESIVSRDPTSERDRARLRALLDREDVQAQLRAYGVSAEEAAVRVNALTDQEVEHVVRRLDEVPAGGNPGALIALLVVVVVYGAVYAAVGIALLIGLVITAAVRAANRDTAPGSAAATTTPESTAPPADLKWPPLDSGFVVSVQESGSYGTATRTQTIHFLGERAWQGKSAFAFSDGTVTSYYDSQRRLLARVNGDDGTLREAFEPYFVLADWPLSVGKWWPNRYRYDDRTSGRSFADVRYDGEVEAYEDVTTPAGTFKAFRIALGGNSSKHVLWYSDDLGFVVKMRAERFSNHYLGSGVSEMELVSYELTP